MVIRIENIKEDDSIRQSIKLLIEEYKLNLEAYNRSPDTISWYLEILNQFFDFLESSNLLKPIPELGRGELAQYTHFLQHRKRWPNREHNGKDLGGLSESAIQGHVRAVKAFWGWLTREEYIEKNVLSKYPLPEVSEYIIPTLSIEQVDKLLAVIDRNTALGAKYYAYCCFYWIRGCVYRSWQILRWVIWILVMVGLLYLGKGGSREFAHSTGLLKRH